MSEPTPGVDYCACPMDTRCTCGFADRMTQIFFPGDREGES